MDIGNIPGYYFDKDKQKYFRIQADHKLPEQARYSTSNVQRERRAHERASKAERGETRRKRHTRIAWALSKPHLSSSLLLRETGTRNSSQTLGDGEHALVDDLILSRHRPPPRPAQHSDSLMLSAFTLRHPHEPRLLVQSKVSIRLLDMNLCEVQDDVGLFNADWYAEGLHPAKWSRDGQTYVYAFFASRNTLRFYTLGLADWQPEARVVPVPWWIHPDNGVDMVIRDACISSYDKVAVACTNELLCVELAGSGTVRMLPVEREVTTVDWLTKDTMVAGQVKNVRLWDVRTKDSSSRIHHKKRVTGVQTVPGSDGSQILVSDNHGMRMYDLRMTSKNRDRCPLVFTGTHGGPRSTFDINRQGLVAAYLDEQVKVLSLRTGRQLRDLELPSTFPHSGSLVKPADVKQLSWEELSRGSPYIQICTPTELWRWRARGAADD